jgi:pimeloyl-ACP methyl ester carboxylesterase
MQPVAILIPGLTCDATFWANQEAVLSQDRPVAVPKLHDFTSLTDMARSILDAHVGPLDVIGHSMGGRVAFEVVRLAPERVRTLAVLDTGSHPVGANEPAGRQRRLDLAAEGGMEAVAADWVPEMVHPDRRQDHALLDRITAMVTSYTVEQYRGQINALLTRPDAGLHLGAIECPTLVAVGRDDAWSPVVQHEQIAAAIDGARLEVIEQAGHMVAMERPAETTDLLAGWLTQRT